MNPNLFKGKDLLQSTKNLLRNNDKRFVQILTSKISEGKLRNFKECQIFCVISCPYSSYFESEEYKGILIINPIELFIGFNIDHWEGLNIMDCN